MKMHAFWFIAIAAALCGCADHPLVTYDQPLTSPGGEFSKLPPAVQNSVRAEAGMAEIESVRRNPNGPTAVYVVRFRNEAVYPPLYLASDGSVLTSNLTVAVGASVDSIAASTGSEAGGLKLDDLPQNVVLTIRHSAPTGEVDAISRTSSGGQVFYSVTFKDPTRHPTLTIRDNGRLVQ
jgi:hypothetical protein